MAQRFIKLTGKISIHALREEGDDSLCASVMGQLISIHALREEGDRPQQFFAAGFQNFYPRPPRGGRPSSRPAPRAAPIFLSTPSARRATMVALLLVSS